MADRRDDARGKKIVFVSSCLLNTNNKVKGLARYSGMCREVFDTLCDNGLGIQQMDCPETLYLGIQRWWYTKNLYDCRGFRDHCRELAERSVTYMEEYAREGYKVVAVLSCDGSPTCGVTITSYDKKKIDEMLHLPDYAKKTEIKIAEMGNDAGIIGAATLGM